MPLYSCQLPGCDIQFKRRKHCKVKWMLEYCTFDHRDEDRPRRKRETKRKSMAAWRKKQR